MSGACGDDPENAHFHHHPHMRPQSIVAAGGSKSIVLKEYDMKASFAILLTLVMTALTTSLATAAMSQPRGLEKYGYPVVLASVNFVPGRTLVVTVPDQVSSGTPAGYATFTIPAHAFAEPVTIRFLAAKNSAWDQQVSPKLKVIANFAYLITDKEGKIVSKFNEPIMYTVKDSMISEHSIYWATTPHNPPKLIDANKASTIKGMTLSHPTPVSKVGWIITTPKDDLHMGSTNGSKM